MEQADLDLIRQARRGKPEALADIVRNYQQFVYRTAYGVLQNATDAEDATQEAFIKAFRSLKQLREERTFPTWLARIAVRVSLDMLASRQRRAQSPSDEVSAAVSGAEDAAAARIDVDRALARLNEEHRTVIVLRAFHGLEYDEIAQVLDIPVGTVRSRLHHARMQLRRFLGGERGDG
ncbi:RNA polymerase, sigma-24 subunit, ECF subfamily [Alicyclobacillus hesperidum URH17-3-68]|uniref:RNA polymerase sigma factor n=1 Tax=Alicyclobacillus hesperidum TaxID=89784 RepID=A0A1H2WZ51_9BACL|nr:sigma-70 family RNA polymerase sigma factor [Alicyclobacillus hesperidum]EJY55730.1 RNA polymerase, sigma-24 subunit, ECF subfamily [Alicyclobacillus hesperidum URH17-3-68]GLG02665.1 RNA polymerase sigma factor [Alicyclobacillus hesperidum subsp. aegles]GLV13005.1 RNA polymerase sigma factor [Alicyclobacillus hesperidum]SDW85827.1 RNA polymerase, sigma subunit, ECF family [Alicyclobacillus hesperidum]